MERAGRAGGRERTVRRSGTAAKHGRDARHQGFVDLLRADEVDVSVEAASGEDFALAGNHFGAGADDDRNAKVNVRIAGLADAGNVSFLMPTSALTIPQ